MGHITMLPLKKRRSSCGSYWDSAPETIELGGLIECCQSSSERENQTAITTLALYDSRTVLKLELTKDGPNLFVWAVG
ncbi:hypothetical protein VFPPC_15404 [Pochonia chlamydosporia 170]|uniref:Uncharacterized protein n=1 Tax=Pochonia chlamydosporia 170 TaxID=1380566 RepID=A0A179G9J0_METCM|nr:hypothetical protein VFPPC_15404 [Pochonia chlamydosporia 170]OAQ74053.1 hypothetical protein VFPPC_15404 [Pochonia chlamydosporia 170]